MGEGSIPGMYRWRDREYAYRTLQVQYTFSVREYTHTEKVFASRTQAKQLACSSPQLSKNPYKIRVF